MKLPRLGFGGASIGNLYGSVSDAEAAEAVDAAWDVGWRYFDTAPHYGLGLSERRLGAALRSRDRASFVLSTKVGRRLVPASRGGRDTEGFDVPATHERVWDFSADGVNRSVDESLNRMGTPSVDILFLHDPDDHWEEAVSSGYPALAALRSAGVVRAIGAGMNQAEMLADFVRHTDIDVVMLAGRYTLFEQGALSDLLPLCVARDVSVIAVGVFNSGLLAAASPGGHAKYNYSDAPPSVLARAQRLAEVCARHDVPLPAAALQFPLAHPAVASVAVGCRTADHVRRNAALLETPIPDDLWAELRDEGLLAEDAPVPVSEATA